MLLRPQIISANMKFIKKKSEHASVLQWFAFEIHIENQTGN